MRVVVTCGPSYEPIDEVRRITNFSTGELGARLASRLAEDGHEVICLRGVAATREWPLTNVRHVPFSTNADLLEKLRAIEDRASVGAFFHTAALADFTVERSSGERKLSSRVGNLTLTLVPAPKVIGSLRASFPNAWIVGWKFELDGTREDVIAKGLRQIVENGTDVCVLNGAAYGDGFGVLEPNGAMTHFANRAELSDALAKRLRQARSAR